MHLRPDVVAGKYDPAQFDPSGQFLLVNEVFYSLQGEGARAGRPTVFIRLAKCNLQCKFCDTEFNVWHKLTVQDVVDRVNSAVHATFANVGPARVNLHEEILIDITGGEPLLQNFSPLVLALREDGWKDIGVETSGSVWNEAVMDVDWITVSPKVRLEDVPDKLRRLADEFKWVVNDAFLRQHDGFNHHVDGALNFLQPESNTPKYITAAVNLILANPDRYRLSLQQHKFAGVP